MILDSHVTSAPSGPLVATERLGALFASFLPIVLMASRGLNGDVRIGLTLASMHVAAYVPCVTLMPRLATIRLQETHS